MCFFAPPKKTSGASQNRRQNIHPMYHVHDSVGTIIDIAANNETKEWIIYMLDAVDQTSRDTILKVNKIKTLLEKTIEKVKKEAPKIYSKELVEALFHQPYCKISFLVEHGIAERKAAARYLDTLEKIGVLTSQQIWKEKIFVNVKLYRLLSGKQNA